jgi:polyisoprenyl-phosphate glycosyltransferase
MPSSATPLLSIILPVFNEELGIPRLLAALRSFREVHADLSTEIIFVDDHSSDATPDLLADACRSEPGLRYLRLTRNSGSHIAILAGMAHIRGECAVFLAADLQDPVDLLPQMIQLWRQGVRVVWAVRERREKISLTERIMARVFYWLMNRLSDLNLPPTGTDFALLDRHVVKALLASVGANPSIVADIASLGFRSAHVLYIKHARKFGKSKWTKRMRLKAFADAFVGHTFAPIRFMSYIGLACASLGFVGAIAAVVLRLLGITQGQGWASLMATILTIGGIQMTMLGVLGEYLWRALSEVRRKHLYIIDDDVSCDFPANAPLAVKDRLEDAPLLSNPRTTDNRDAASPNYVPNKDISS